MARERADLVVVGAGTVGGWASVLARGSGAGHVVVLESETAGNGASSRAAGMVRAQGGTPDTVRLGAWSIDFYRSQAERFGVDSGFSPQGYVILASTVADERAAHERIAMQRSVGLAVRWVEPQEIRSLIPAMGDVGYRGGSYVATDGWIDPPRNILAYTLAMERTGVQLRERTAFLGLRTRRGRSGARVVTGVETTSGTIATGRVLLTGGPSLRAVAAAADARAWVGFARHQVAITSPSDDLHGESTAMAFDLRAGIYWRPEERGLLWGMSNPAETPGAAREIDWPYLRRMQRRLQRLMPRTTGLGLRKVWAATIEYTPDHQPLLGPLVRPDGVAIEGATIAGACGHGMMWGPAVSRIAVDLALTGTTSVVENPEHFRMDRFDEQGRSPFIDPVALPFPVRIDG